MTEIRHQHRTGKNAKVTGRQKFIVGEQANKTVEQVLNAYQTHLLGLSENEALDRLVSVGKMKSLMKRPLQHGNSYSLHLRTPLFLF